MKSADTPARSVVQTLLWFEADLQETLVAARRRRQGFIAVVCGLTMFAAGFTLAVIDRPRVTPGTEVGKPATYIDSQTDGAAAPSGLKARDELRTRLAVAEGSAAKQDDGYGEVNDLSGGLGRYQMTPIALSAVGMVDAEGKWTGKYGISSPHRFLADRDAQEQALTEFLNETERQMNILGLFRYIGAVVTGKAGHFAITRSGLLAAGHRAGPTAVRDYFRKITISRFSSRTLRLSLSERAVETRLRTFADCAAAASGS
jgi:hypothetical protein